MIYIVQSLRALFTMTYSQRSIISVNGLMLIRLELYPVSLSHSPLWKLLQHAR